MYDMAQCNDYFYLVIYKVIQEIVRITLAAIS